MSDGSGFHPGSCAPPRGTPGTGGRGACFPLARRTVHGLALSFALGSAAHAANLAVTSTSDLVNGDVSSPAALAADPGPDGMSLREAVEAANAVEKPHFIRFSAALEGSTIALQRELLITQDGVSLVGIHGQAGPGVTIDGASMAPPPHFSAMLFIHASDCRVAHLRFVGIIGTAIEVEAGEQIYPPQPPASVSHVRIEDNVFDNTGFPDTQESAIRIWTEPPPAFRATISDVRVERNVFRNLSIGGVLVTAAGYDVTFSDLVIRDNHFVGMWAPIEVGHGGGSGNVIEDTLIIGNRIEGGVVPIFVAAVGADNVPVSESNTITGTTIARNVIRGQWDSIGIGPSHSTGVGVRSVDNLIADSLITNNVVFAGRGIDVVGGAQMSTGNRVSGVRIVNNTILTEPLASVRVESNRDGGHGNSVDDVVVVNCILGRRDPEGHAIPDGDIEGEITPADVSYTLTSVWEFVGVNGNISGDPLFVDRLAGDLHLCFGSPAIDAGTSDWAPTADVEGFPRPFGGGVDMGAYEFHGPRPPRRITRSR